MDTGYFNPGCGNPPPASLGMHHSRRISVSTASPVAQQVSAAQSRDWGTWNATGVLSNPPPHPVDPSWRHRVSRGALERLLSGVPPGARLQVDAGSPLQPDPGFQPSTTSSSSSPRVPGLVTSSLTPARQRRPSPQPYTQCPLLSPQPVPHSGSSGYGSLGSNGSHEHLMSQTSSSDSNGHEDAHRRRAVGPPLSPRACLWCTRESQARLEQHFRFGTLCGLRRLCLRSAFPGTHFSIS